MKRLLFLLLLPSICSGSTYFVATTGNDSTGDGSIGNPFLTPQHCVLALGTAGSAATGICYLRVGTYNGSIGGFYNNVPHGTSWASAITIQAYNNEVVTLTNTGSAGSIIGFATDAYPTPRSFYWQFIGLIVDGTSNTSDELVGGLSDDYVRFQNGRVHGGLHQGIEPHGDHWDLLNMEVDHNGTIGNPTPDHGVYSPGAYLLVDGGSYHDNASYGIQIYDMGSTIVSYNIVRNARIYRNDIGNTQGGGMILSQGTNNIAYNNLIYDNGQDGLDLQGLQPFAFNNTICGNTGASVRIYSASDAAQVQNNALCEGVTLESGNPGPITNNFAATTSSFTNYAGGIFTIPSTSAMRGYALNLTVSTIPFSSPVSTFGVVYPELLIDLAGVARPSVAAWDAGAYQFAAPGPPVVSPATPIVNQGATLQFTADAAGTWACSGTNSTGGVTACSGSINSTTGLYTAPSSVTAQHVYGGMQMGPNNDVYNTRIDSMPVHPSNTLYMATVNTGGTPNWNLDFPINYVTPLGATDTMSFLYTPANNGSFEVPSFPTAKSENGWFSALQGRSGDHHIVMVDTGTAIFSEFYQYYPNCVTTAASVTSNVATLTCSVNPQSNQFVVGTTVTIGSFSGSDTYFNVGTASITAVTSNSISFPLVHVNATASTNGSVSKLTVLDTTGRVNSASGIRYSSMTYVLPNLSTDAAGMQLQPLILGLQEFERAVTTNGTINHAMRNTFGIGFEASSSTWPATSFATDGSTIPFGVRLRLKAGYNISAFSAPAQVLLKNLKQYGTFNVDGGNNWPMNAEATRWPKVYYDALAEVSAAVIVSSMEFVNESSIMISTASSLTTNNREKIVFTRTSDSSTTVVDVALQGPAINFAKDAVYIMAGTPAQQLTVLNNYGGYTCAMSPSTGTLTSGCLYTPPATVSAATTTIITATSIINSSASAIMTLTVFPSTGIYAIPSKTSNYTDASGNTWVARTGISNFSDTQGCCSCDNIGSFPVVPDVSLWNCAINNTFQGADLHMDFLVPNGTYQVVYHYGTLGLVGQQFNKYSIGSTEVFPNFDPSATAGGQFKLFTSTNTTVTNNQLQVGVWTMNDVGSAVSSLSVTPSTPTVTTTASESIRGKVNFRGSVRIR